MLSIRAAVVALIVLAMPWPSAAKLIEEKVMMPVQAAGIDGKVVAREIIVTIFRDDAAARPYPVLIINHGRSPHREDRIAPGRMRIAAVSSWFAGLGFLVAVPTRVGYGSSGGEDVEYSGPCNGKNYAPVYAASTAQTLQVLTRLRTRADVARDRAVILGQSFGGTTSIALAARNPAGVQATINFAGGGGGNPRTMPQQPCDQPQLEALFAGYGKTARVPTLWVYSANDMYFGPRLPKLWFGAFRGAGGVGEFMQYPASGDDGHRLFESSPATWQPRVQQFLRANGYPGLGQGTTRRPQTPR